MLEGKKVVVTGTLEHMKRSEAESRLKSVGATVVGSVSKNTDILFVGLKPGSKLVKAEKLGVKVLTEKDLMKALKGSAAPKPAKKAAKPKVVPKSGLAGKKVVVTGTLSKMKRSDAKTRLEAAGAIVVGSISKNTDLLVAGDKAGSKLEKAASLGVETVNEDQFLRLLEDESAPEEVELEGALADYLPRLKEKLAELEEHPNVHMINSYIGPPVSEAVIADVQERLGVELDPAITNFYRQCDGCSFVWAAKDNPRLEEEKARSKRRKGRIGLHDITGDYFRTDGSLNMLPFKEAFVTANWAEHHYFDWMEEHEDDTEYAGKAYGLLEFSKSLRIFDYFNFYNMAAFVTIHDPANPPIAIGDDHGACWTDSRFIDFTSYMESVLANYGSVQMRRSEMMGYDGHSKKPARWGKSYWEKKKRSLNDVMKIVRDGF